MTLSEYLTQHGITRYQFTRRGGWPTNLVYKWCAGVSRPSAENQRRIAEMTQSAVMPNDWVGVRAPAPAGRRRQ